MTLTPVEHVYNGEVRDVDGRLVIAQNAQSSHVTVDNYPLTTEIANDEGNPIPVIGTIEVSNLPGVVAAGQAAMAGDKALSTAGVRNDNGVPIIPGDFYWGAFAIDAAGRTGICDLGGSITVDSPKLDALNSLVPSVYDFIDLNYTGSDLTQVLFKSGGASGTLVSTLTLVYAGGLLDTVTKT